MKNNMMFAGYLGTMKVFAPYREWIMGRGGNNEAVKALMTACRSHGASFVYSELCINDGVGAFWNFVDIDGFDNVIDIYHSKEDAENDSREKIRLIF